MLYQVHKVQFLSTARHVYLNPLKEVEARKSISWGISTAKLTGSLIFSTLETC